MQGREELLVYIGANIDTRHASANRDGLGVEGVHVLEVPRPQRLRALAAPDARGALQHEGLPWAGPAFAKMPSCRPYLVPPPQHRRTPVTRTSRYNETAGARNQVDTASRTAARAARCWNRTTQAQASACACLLKTPLAQCELARLRRGRRRGCCLHRSGDGEPS